MPSFGAPPNPWRRLAARRVAADPYLRTGGERFAPVELAPDVRAHLKAIEYPDGPMAGRVSQVVGWESWPMTKRIGFLRLFAEDTSRDPAIAKKALEILRLAGAKARDTRAQWAALLKWVQRNIYYVNEPNERLQSPQYTLTERHGDCDDMAILLFALGHSIRLPVRYVISGKAANGARVRWIEGIGPVPQGVNWAHIYLQVGGPPFRPTWWAFAEPTLNVPLGWDVISANGKLPEMAGAEMGDVSTTLATAPKKRSAKDVAVDSVKAIDWPKVATLGVASALTTAVGFWVGKQLKKR